MRRLVFVVLISFFAFPWPAFAEEVKFDDLMQTVLPVPSDAAFREYLGLSGKETFVVPDLPAKVAVIEIFSMYCPHCQREAPDINRLFRKIADDEKLGKAVRFIGIGAGNTDFEVGIFKKKFDIPFPLFSDGDFAIYNRLGGVRTPYFIAIRIGDKGSHTLFYSKAGGIADHEGFLDLLRRHALR